MPAYSPLLLTVDEAKAHLDLKASSTTWDTLLLDLVEEAEGAFQSFTTVPVVKAAFTELHDGGGRNLLLRRCPISQDVADAPVVTDTKGTNLDASDDEVLTADNYRLRYDAGLVIRATANGYPRVWEPGIQRWKVTYKAGHDQREDWTSVAKADVRRTIRLLVVEQFERQMGATQTQNGGITRMWQNGDLPEAVSAVWYRFRPDVGYARPPNAR